VNFFFLPFRYGKPACLFIRKLISFFQGLLYDRGYSCVQNPPEALPGLPAPFNNGTKIALIRIGQCSLVQKVLLAQNDNANATIIYINGDFDSETNQLMVRIYLSLFVILVSNVAADFSCVI
jgi:hypothetical protein